jgi:glycosyltransferase involved in cell wall biosynthesis
VTAIVDASFVLETSGVHEGPPSAAVREYLVEHGARRVTTIIHPLNPEAPPEHLIETWSRGQSKARWRRVRLPSRPPLTYPLDLLVPPVLPRADAFIGFNNLATARALAARAAGRLGRVAYWAVDFVPDRFGAGSPITRAYDALDRLACRRADARFEVSEAALRGRDERHGLSPSARAPARVVPMGAWLDRVPQAPEDNHGARRVVWIGHMVERQGVERLIEALGLLAGRGVEFEAELAGRGPEEPAIRAAVARLGLEERVSFLGYVDDHRALERILARASVATAPYHTGVESFTRFADPAKLKAYLAAGLPIVTTEVPPNAHGGGEIVRYDAQAMAAAIERALADPVQWRRRRAAALELAREYDWGRLVPRALDLMGYEAAG